MKDKAWQELQIVDFKGSWSLIDQDDIPDDGARKALNVTFVPGQVQTRYGFGLSFTPACIITSMFHWLFGDDTTSGKSYLVWYKSGYGVQYADLSSPSATNAYAVTGAYGAVFAPAGGRFYAAHYNTSGVGADGGRVFGVSTGAEPLFVRPMLTSEVTVVPTLVSPGGAMTPGVRKVAFILTTKNGYAGRPSPVDISLTLQPATVTTTSANRQVLMTFTPTPTWPTYAASIQIIMTTTVDQATYYYVPGAVLAVPAGGALAVTYTLNISDDDLVASSAGFDPTDNFFFLTQDSSNVPPFKPSSVFLAGNRMAYVFRASQYGQGVFISNPNAYQQGSAQSNILYLPGQQEVTTGFYRGGSICLIGPNWTFSVGDTGGDPVTWPPAECIDSSIGTICPEGVSFDIARGIGWVAHTSGLYRFAGGRYDQMPVSYMNTYEWGRINWQAFYALRVVDDVVNKTVFTAAPLLSNGRVNTNGTAFTYVSGDEFCPAWKAGQTITINAVNYTIVSSNRTAGVLNTTAGVQSNVAYSVTPTYNTHLMAWNYTGGDSASQVKFSMWFIKDYAPSAMAMVQNYSTKVQELWLGQSPAIEANGAVWRYKNPRESTLYRDSTAALDSIYQTAYYPTYGEGGGVWQHHGVVARVKGSGNLALTAEGLDGTPGPISLLAIAASSAPGQEYDRWCRLISERASYSISNGATLDNWFELSLLRPQFSKFVRTRK
jgi:hypothetical protein